MRYMGKYDSRLSSITDAEIIARLEGSRGLLALSSRDLFFVDDNSEQSAALSNIKRIGVNKQSGNVDVSGEQGALMHIPPSAFQKDELKLFLESLKSHVLRAKTEIVNPAPVEVAPPPPPPKDPTIPPEPVSAAFDDDPFPAAVHHEQMVLPPRDPTPVPDFESPRFVPEADETPMHIIDPTKTLPDDPNSIWAYEGGAQPVITQEVPPKPVSSFNLSSEESAPVAQQETSAVASPPAIANAPVIAPSPTQRTGFLLLKVWSLVTLLFAGAYLGLNLLNPSGTDPMVSVGVLIGGVALALIQWRLSEPL